MLSLDELTALIDGIAVAPPGTEWLPLDAAAGRIVASDIAVPFDQPREALSAMDGYAIRFADFFTTDGSSRRAPGSPIPVSQRIPAGSAPAALASASAARIFTGALLPEGADTVVMQEHVQTLDDVHIALSDVPRMGQHVRKPGDELRSGQCALQKGDWLSPGAMGLLASIGVTSVNVYRKARVGLLFTGDELRQPGEALARGQIYNSNRWMWRALMQRAYLDIVDIGQVADTLDATRVALRTLSDCDLILSSGGVSVGEEDHVRDAVEREGQLQAWKVAMKPGKPIAIGQVGRGDGSSACFAGLPGNPVSSYAGFLLLLRPLLWRVAGGGMAGVGGAACLPLSAVQQPRIAAFSWSKPDVRRTEFLRARVMPDGQVALHPQQQSAALAAVAWADGFVRIAPGLVVNPGDSVPYLPVSALQLPG